MTTYEYEHTVTTSAPAEAVWALWSEVGSWPRWDTSVRSVTIDGEFAVGGTGTMVIEGQGAIPFRLVEVTPGVGFTDETEIPGALLRFVHTVSTVDGQTAVTHRVEIEGEQAREFGPMVTEDVPGAMAGLVRLAEATVAA